MLLVFLLHILINLFHYLVNLFLEGVRPICIIIVRTTSS